MGDTSGVAEDAKHRKFLMELAKAADELAVFDEVVPSLADKGCADQAGGVCWEGEKDLDEDIIWQLTR